MDASTARELHDGDGPRQDAPCAILRGTARGLEMVVDGRGAVEAIAAALETRLAEAPAFFRGSDVRVTVDHGPLAAGVLTRLDDLAQRFGLRIVEVAARARAIDPALLALGNVAIPATSAGAAGSVPIAVEPEVASQPSKSVAEPSPAAQTSPMPVLVDDERRLKTRIVEGPVRSGAILDHVGHMIVFGDVNPGAEVRATGNIVVLGALRGTAHAGIGRDAGFILALQLEPQQLRVGRKVARADANIRASAAEIAYATGDSIVVEKYSGRLPRNLSASI